MDNDRATGGCPNVDSGEAEVPNASTSKKDKGNRKKAKAAPEDRRSESEIQKAYFKKVRAAAFYDELYGCILSIPNGANLPTARNAETGAVFSNARNKLVAEGLLAGASDVLIAIPVGIHHGCFMEFKRPKKTRSDAQIEFQSRMTALGYECVVVFHEDEAWEITTRIVGEFRYEQRRKAEASKG